MMTIGYLAMAGLFIAALVESGHAYMRRLRRLRRLARRHEGRTDAQDFLDHKPSVWAIIIAWDSTKDWSEFFSDTNYTEGYKETLKPAYDKAREIVNDY